MLDLGLRVGEVAALTVDCFDLGAETLTFYRPKVDRQQTHELKNGCLAAARAWIESGDAPALGNIWRTSRKGGGLQDAGWSIRAITKRVAALGELVGAPSLSAHDLRHSWATQAARNGTSLDRLQDAGGWSSLAMPGRYIEAAKIANKGVKLGEE
jgi:integrase